MMESNENIEKAIKETLNEFGSYYELYLFYHISGNDEVIKLKRFVKYPTENGSSFYDIVTYCVNDFLDSGLFQENENVSFEIKIENDNPKIFLGKAKIMAKLITKKQINSIEILN